METIQIKYFADIIPLEYKQGSDWVDLRCAEDTIMKAGEYKAIPLGVAMKFPPEYEANIVPRSSTFKNYGIIQANHFGVVDHSYCGNDDKWYFLAVAMRDTFIPKNERICQFRLNKRQDVIKFEIVEDLPYTSRGGIGSTGKK